MSIAFGQGVETGGVRACIGNLNPIAKLAITTVITVGLLLSLDQTTATIIVIIELLALPFVGLKWRTIAIRGGLLLMMSALIVVINAIFSANTDGFVFIDWGPFTLSTAGLAAASVIGIRVFALSLPAVLLLSTTDPVLLSDGVQQQLRVPARYAMSSVVGLRLLPLLASDWTEMSAARRARGMTSRNPVTALASGASRLVGLLVIALRRAIRMAMAMQARGFDPYAPRSAARISRLHPGDYLAMAAALVVVLGATYIAIRNGDWQFSLLWPNSDS